MITPADHPAQAPVTPAWQFLADLFIGRLQISHAGCLWEDIPAEEADKDTEEACTDEPATATSMEQTTERPVQSPSNAIPTRQLLNTLSLSATIGSQEQFDALCVSGAITVISQIDFPDLENVADILRICLPGQTCKIIRPTVSESSVSKHAEERLTSELLQLLDKPQPVIVLLPIGLSLPPFMRQTGPRVLPFSPIRAETLEELLRRRDTANLDLAAFSQQLPPDVFLSRLDTATVAAVLRMAPVAQLAERLGTITGSQTTGPRLETDFVDSPAVKIAKRMVSDLLAWRAGEIAWSDFSHSLLLFGPPGTGKTWLARAMGNSAGIACVTASFAEWQSAGHLGDMLREMRKSFANARRLAPAILFIDEIDAVGSRSGDDRHGENYRLQVINGFLGEMNSLATEAGVLVVGACNHPDRIDSAIIRAGRFDHKVEMPLPDSSALLALLQRALPTDADQAGLEKLARQSVGQSLASLDAAIRAARSDARYEKRALNAELVRKHLKTPEDDSTRDILWRIAVHEAGHAIASIALGLGTIQSISISESGGLVRYKDFPRHGLLSDAENEICRSMAGRAAERLVLGQASAGSGGPVQSDLAVATHLALSIETTWGLGASGPVWLGYPEAALERQEELKARVRQRIEAAEARAGEILTAQRSVLLRLAQVLLDRRDIGREEASRLLGEALSEPA